LKSCSAVAAARSIFVSRAGYFPLERLSDRDFFSILAFLIIILEMNPVKHFFPNLALLSHANPFGATYEGVTPVHLARLKELARARVATLAEIVPRRISHAS
jgi:hypothetical protein